MPPASHHHAGNSKKPRRPPVRGFFTLGHYSALILTERPNALMWNRSFGPAQDKAVFPIRLHRAALSPRLRARNRLVLNPKTCHEHAAKCIQTVETFPPGEGAKAIAVASACDLEWVDPVVGGRMRHQFASGSEFNLEGDVGGFGAGSEFSWQAVATYGFDVNVFNTTP